MKQTLTIQELTEPSVEPLDFSDAAEHLRLDGHEDRELVMHYIAAARDHAESLCKRRLCRRTFRVTGQCFADPIDLRGLAFPLVSVEAVKYLDVDGAEQVLPEITYRVAAASGRITPAINETWPSTLNRPDAITIDITAGHDVAPPAAKQLMRLLLGHMYENREAMAGVAGSRFEVSLAVRSLAHSLRP